jgi:hypothetical protein
MSWEAVEAHRQQHGLDPWMVPLASAHGVLAWGVPFKAGRPLRRLQPAADQPTP